MTVRVFGKNLNLKYSILDLGFYGALSTKAFIALTEFAGGLLMILLNHDGLLQLIRQIASPELKEDPHNFLVNYFTTLGQNLSISTQHSVAIYLMLHSAAKLLVVWLLWGKKLRAYPFAIGVLCLFIAFELFSVITGHSYLMILFMLLDIAVTGMTLMEYRRMKAGQK